jgi:hypothetical protein
MFRAKGIPLFLFSMWLIGTVWGCSRGATPAAKIEEGATITGLSSSGIEGQILRGPMCPGPVRPNTPCPDQPFSATFTVVDAEERLVTRFQTDAQGRFRLLLPPGVYTIIPEPSAPVMRPGSQRRQITVSSQQFTQVTLVFDTGMR